MKPPMFVVAALAVGITLGWLGLPTTASPSSLSFSSYTITGLGHLPGGGSESAAFAVNNNNQVVGFSDSSGTLQREAFLWTPTSGMTTMTGFTGGAIDSHAYGINDAGQVVGDRKISGDTSSSGRRRAVLWDPTAGVLPLTGLPEPIDNATSTQAWDINSSGQVAARAPHASGTASGTGTRGYLWDPLLGARSIGALVPDAITQGVQARHINENGAIAGFDDTTSTRTAVMWDPETEVLTSITPGVAGGINSANEVVGSTESGDAFLWDPVTGLEILAMDAAALGIGEHGVVVGGGWNRYFGRGTDTVEEALIWDSDHSLYRVNGLLNNHDGQWWIIGLTDINDAGVAVGYAFHRLGGLEGPLVQEAVLLTPSDLPPQRFATVLPEPPLTAMIVLLGGLLVRFRLCR